MSRLPDQPRRHYSTGDIVGIVIVVVLGGTPFLLLACCCGYDICHGIYVTLRYRKESRRIRAMEDGRGVWNSVPVELEGGMRAQGGWAG